MDLLNGSWDNLYIIFEFTKYVCLCDLFVYFFLTTKMTDFFQGGERGGYFKGKIWTSTKSTLHYYELNETFWFLLITFFHLGGRQKKKEKVWLNSLKIDKTNKIHAFPQSLLTFL